MFKAIFLVLPTMILPIFATSCTDPIVEYKNFASTDVSIITHVAFVVEISIVCKEGELTDDLYARINEKDFLPVVKIGDHKYQISWIEEIKNVKKGNRTVYIYDADGYGEYRRALRRGLDPKQVPALLQVEINHPGLSPGSWFRSEFFAATICILVAYIAFNFRSKIM